MLTTTHDQLIVQRIKAGDQHAWQELINLYEGRLLAFCRSKVNSASIAEDLVQDTLLGFLTSLPNYDENTPIEAFLFSIANYKIIDHLRKQGRRQTNIASELGDSFAMFQQFSARERMASSMLRSQERKSQEAEIIQQVLLNLVTQWKQQEEFERLKSIELLLVCGVPNKEVARVLNLTEQQVANHKQFVLNKLKDAVQLAGCAQQMLANS